MAEHLGQSFPSLMGITTVDNTTAEKPLFKCYMFIAAKHGIIKREPPKELW